MLRKSFAHALGVTLLLIQLILVALAGILLFVILSDVLPVPGFVKTRIERELARRGLEASFTSAAFTTHGQVIVEGLRLTPARFGEPVIEAGRVVLDFDELFLAAGMLELTSIRAEDARVICPSSLSPDGAPFALLEIDEAHVIHQIRSWELRSLLARCGTVHVVASGTALPPPRRTDTTPPDPTVYLDQFARLAPRLARMIEHTKTLAEPRIEISFDLQKTGFVSVDVTSSAAAWHGGEAGEFTGLVCSTAMRFWEGRIEPFQVDGQVGSWTHTDGSQVEGLSFSALWNDPPTAAAPWPLHLSAAATRATHPKVAVEGPTLRVDTGEFPVVSAQISGELVHEAVEVNVRADVHERSGEATVHGRVGRDWLAHASTVLGRDVTYYLGVGDPPDFTATATFGQDLRWRDARYRITSGPVVARGVALDRARIRGTATPERVSISRLEISKADQSAIGTYEDELDTRDYRLLLTGTMRPLNIAPWFGPWWGNFWRDYEFGATPPWVEVDVRNSWKDGKKAIVHGRGRAERGTIRGVPYTGLSTGFFIRPDYYDLYNAVIIRPEGRIEGDVQLSFRRGQRDPVRQAFSFKSTADLVDLARIFGAGGERMLAPYRYTVPPGVNATGLVTNDGTAWDTILALDIVTPNEFRFHDFPVSSLNTELHIHNDRVDIRRLTAGYAGGTIRAVAQTERDILHVDASLEDASYEDATTIFNDFLDRLSPPPPDEAEPAGLAARKVGGRLSLTVDATGPIATFDAYTGAGTLQVSEANLGQVKIFGVLFDVLRPIGLKVGMVNFNELKGPFEIRRDRVFFPKLRVTGASAALETDGTYYVNSKNLDFRARLYPLRESSGSLIQIFEFIIDPVSFLLEVRLTGTLRKPTWTLSRMPFAARPEVDTGATAPQPAPATDTPAPTASPD